MESRELEVIADQALLDHLKRCPDQTSHLPQAGLIVRKAGFKHAAGLKKWLLGKPHLFEVLQPDYVRIAPAQEGAQPGFDDPRAEDALEAALVQYLKENPGWVHLGTHVGRFCNEQLGLNTKGKLGRFVASRPSTFILRASDKQFVRLVPACDQPGPSQAEPAPVQQRPSQDGMPAKRVVTVRPLPKEAMHARPRSNSTSNEYAVPPAPDVQPPPGFEDTPVPPAKRGLSPQLDCTSNADLLQGFAKLQGQYDTLQAEVDAIKRHLGLLSDAPATSASAMNGSSHSARPNGVPAGQTVMPPRTLLMGGHDGAQWVASSVRLSKMQWSDFAPLPTPIAFAAAGSIYGHVLLMGGCDSGNKWLSSVLRCAFSESESEGAWESMSGMSVARGSLAVSFCNGGFYAIGGGLPSAQMSIVERYDAITDQWTKVEQLKTPRFGPASAVVNGSIFCVGGFDGKKYLSTVEAFDPREGRWRALPGEMGAKRGSLAVCSVSNGHILAVGGVDSSSLSVATCELLDVRANRWRPAAAMAKGRAFGGAVTSSCGSKVWAMGGLEEDMCSYAETMEAYSVQLDSWSIVEPSPMQGLCKERAFFAVACEV